MQVGKVFLGLVVIDCLSMLALNIVLLTAAKVDDFTTFISAVVMFTLVFVVYFAVDGILRENIMQVTACVCLTLMTLVYNVYQVCCSGFPYFLKQFALDTSNGIKIIILILALLFQVGFCVVGWKIYLEFGWKVYKKIGADPQMRAMYRIYQFFLTMVKIDFAFAIVLICMASVYFIPPSDYEFWVNLVALALTFAWVWFGFKTMKEEMGSWIGLKGYFIFAAVEPAYICFKFFRFYTRTERYASAPVPLLVTMGTVGIVVRVLLVYVTVLGMRNFGKGLKEQLSGSNAGSSDRRMTIV